MSQCPCASQASFADCCEPFLLGTKPIATPMELMRSRYSAHVRGDAKYLIFSTLPEQQTQMSPVELQDWLDAVRWKSLTILDDGQYNPDSDEGWVEFEALYLEEGKHYLHRERSHFVRRQGHWFFDMHPGVDKWAGSNAARLLGRNDECPCGSGRKLKKCCALL